MNYIKYAIPLALLIAACGGEKKQSVEQSIASNDLEILQSKRVELSTQLKEIEADVAKIDNAISKISPTGRDALVSIYEVKDTVFSHYLDLQATVQTEQNILLNAEFSGVLDKIYVKKGQYVRRGQLLASISDGGIAQQLAQIEIQANLAKTAYERQARLWQNKIGSEMQYLEAKSTYESQQKAVNQIKSQLAKTTVRAPFAGTIDDIITDPGTVVGPGTAIMRLVNLSNMYLEAEIPEQYITGIRRGTETKVEIPVLNKRFETKIHRVSNVINPGNRSFKVEILLPNRNNEIKPNLTARIQVKDYQNNHAFMIPLDVISENADGEQYVFVAQTGDKQGEYLAEKIVVSTGLTQNGMTEIKSGINQGDKIIKEGARSVREGQRISILEN